MASQPNRLVMRTGPTPGKLFSLAKNEIYIGRDITNDIVINDAEVSRKHARLTLQTGGYLLEDLGSTNGTFVDGQRITGPHLLKPGQLVMLADHVSLIYEGMEYDSEATMAVTPQEVTPPTSAVAAPTIPPFQPPLEPAFTGLAPGSPLETPEPPERARRSPSQLWLLAGCGCLAIILGAVFIAILWYIDSQFLWCNVLPFLPACQ